MSDNNFVITLPGAKIEEIIEEYFNRRMFKQKVEIEQSKPTDDGYLFILAFKIPVKQEESVWKDVEWINNGLPNEDYENRKRDSKGRFKKNASS